MRQPSTAPDHSALRIALIYASVAAAWILLSDLILSKVAVDGLATTLSIIKGWGFVVVTAVLLYLVVSRYIRERLKAEEERRRADVAAEQDKRRFYREAILALTEGKFELGDTEDSVQWIQGHELCLCVAGPQDLSSSRKACINYARQQGMAEEPAQDFELAVGEALANAVKHAGGGWLYAGRTPDAVWVAVADDGSGIDTFAIPKVALMTGYTTKASMGLGYTLILDVCDHVKLASGPTGTTVVMQKRLKERPTIEDRLAVHIGIR